MESDIFLKTAMMLGVIIGLYGAVIGIMSSLDYFYINRTRYGFLKLIVLSSIIFSLIITIIGFASLVQSQYVNLWYVTALPGMLGLVLFSLFYINISRRNKINSSHDHHDLYY